MQIHQQLVDEFQIVANIFCCRLPLRVASLCVGLCAGCPSGAWGVVPLFLHDDVMAVFAITSSGSNDIVFVSPYSRAESPKALSSGQSGQRRPELIASNNFRKYAYNTFV